MNDEIIIEEDTNQDEILLDNDTVIYKQEKDYDKLDNKPSINNVELQGNKTLHDLGIQPEGNYVEQEQGKGLSTNDFTTTEKNKLANLENYDDTEIKADIQELETNKANKSETYTKTETDALLQGKADTEDIPDVSEFITKDVNNLTNYTLKTNTGSLIDLEINSTTYVVTLRLKDVDGNVISTDTIDLPLESVVVSGRYDNTTKKVILTLENGSEVDFSVADLVAGLQTEITSTNKLASDLVDDTNSGNKFVTTSEKQTWNNKLDEEDLADYVKNTDYATSNKGGTIKAYTNYGYNVSASTGVLYADTINYNNYKNKEAGTFIGKGTLENVITGKNLETANNKVTEINETSTDTQYPSAKAVHNKMANLGTTKTASGTSIDITDSAEGNMPLGIKGNTSQGENPSPSNPQEVKTVTGEVNVKVQNKNLAKITDCEITGNNLSIKANNGYVEFEATSKNVAYNITGGVWVGEWTQTYTNATDYNLTPEDEGTYILKVYFDKVVCQETYNCIFYIHTNQRTVSYNASLKWFQDNDSKYFGIPITLQEGEHIKQIAYWNNGNITNVEFSLHMQLEKSTTPSEYIEHQEQNYPINLGDIELCKIGDYQDYIYKDNGKWYKHKEIEKVVFNGSESGWAAAGMTHCFGYYKTLNNMLPNINNSSLTGYKLNYFTEGTPNHNWNSNADDYNFTITAEANPNIRITNGSTENKLSEFKTWLSTHNLIFYYLLKTPIEEEITEPTLIAQLETIYNNAKSYEGETHIFTITENESPYIEAEYSIDNVENTVNKVTRIDENSTNKQYPSAKAVYDATLEVYDDQERVIGTWFGKPLYRKVLTGVITSTVNSYVTLLNNISYFQIKNACVSTRGNRPTTFYLATDYNYNSFDFTIENNNLCYRIMNNFNANQEYIIVVEYTKTTDV